MKILFIIHEMLDPLAGASGATLQLGETCQRLGHEVSYFSIDDLPKVLQRLPFYLRKLVFPEFVAAYLSKRMKSQPVDVIDAATGDIWLWASLRSGRSSFRALFKERNAPLLVTRSHGLEHIYHRQYVEEARRGGHSLTWRYPLYRGGLQLWEVAKSLRLADQVFVLNRPEKDYITQRLAVPSNQIHKVKNGFPNLFVQRPFEPTPTATDAPLRIAQIGTYDNRKGIRYSVSALNRLLARYPNLQVSFLGTGSSLCPDAAQVYADFDAAVRDRVTVIPRYPLETLPDLLKGHHIKLFPTLCEGFSLALIEAMACGLAPVTTDAPGPAEVVHHMGNGLVTPVRDEVALEQALELLISDRTLLDRLRHSAYSTAQQYSWENAARDCLALYAQGLSHRSAEATPLSVSSVQP